MPQLADSSSGSPSPGRLGRQRDVLATLGITIGLIAMVAGARAVHRLQADATPEECQQLLERYAEQSLRAVDRDAPGFIVAQHQESARARAEHSDAFRECPSRLTRAQVECAAASGNADEFERCVQ